MELTIFIAAISLGLLLFQGVATVILLSRLLKGAMRQPPLLPKTANPDLLGKVSVVIPTLNEAARIKPCLAGLSHQSYELREVIVVDSNSQDGTPDIVKAISSIDPRFRLISDDPLPSGWIGRPWALHTGFCYSSLKSDWILGIDADTQPQPGLIASLLITAQAKDYDCLSLAPQFILRFPGEWWLQPALLMTLLYRFDSAGVDAVNSSRVMANGQCFLCRREVLEALNGYSSCANSFCDDVTLARNISAAGYKVGFLDGSRLIKVRMYEGMRETWQEWGRSLDLKDAASITQLWGDLCFLLCVQGFPLLLVIIAIFLLYFGFSSLTLLAVLALNIGLLMIRWGMVLAIFPSYAASKEFSRSSLLFWLSPLADPLAVWRIFLSSQQIPKQWRGRVYRN